MSKGCCGYSPRILVNEVWVCNDCGSPVDLPKSEQLDFFGYHPVATKVEPKCQCGADKTYGPGNQFHSAIMPCPLYKKL